MDALSTTTMPSPVGDLTLAASAAGLRALLWPNEREGRVRLAGTGGGGAQADRIVAETRHQLEAYFAGDLTEFDIPLDPVGTDFQLRAWEVLRTIPYGETITYREQALRLGGVQKSRAVGAANGRNPISIIVPCHRVVGTSGGLTGFAGGLGTKAWLLRHEQSQQELPLAT